MQHCDVTTAMLRIASGMFAGLARLLLGCFSEQEPKMPAGYQFSGCACILHPAGAVCSVFCILQALFAVYCGRFVGGILHPAGAADVAYCGRFVCAVFCILQALFAVYCGRFVGGILHPAGAADVAYCGRCVRSILHLAGGVCAHCIMAMPYPCIGCAGWRR